MKPLLDLELDQALQEFESCLGRTLPSSLRTKICELRGVAIRFEQAPTFRPQGFGGPVGFESFYGLQGGRNYDLRQVVPRYAGRVPATTIPIGEDAGGNLFCLDLVTDAVFFWDHEESSDRPDSLYLVAASLDRVWREFVKK